MLEIGKRAILRKVYTLQPGAVIFKGEEHSIHLIGDYVIRYYFDIVRPGDIYKSNEDKCKESEEIDEEDEEEVHPHFLGLD